MRSLFYGNSVIIVDYIETNKHIGRLTISTSLNILFVF